MNEIEDGIIKDLTDDDSWQIIYRVPDDEVIQEISTREPIEANSSGIAITKMNRRRHKLDITL